MGATSVTGISGHGAAEGNKGPGNGRNQFVPLRSPHVVAAGRVVYGESDPGDDGYITEVIFPTPLPGSHTNYVVLLTATQAGQVPYVTAPPDDYDNSDGNFYQFRVRDTDGGTVNWMVVKKGNA